MISNNAKKQPNGALYNLVLWMIIYNLIICIKKSFIFIILNLTLFFLCLTNKVYLIKQIVVKSGYDTPFG